MKGNNEKPPTTAGLCTVCQRFFGNPQTNNMCSACYKSHLSKLLGGPPADKPAAAAPAKAEEIKQPVQEEKVPAEAPKPQQEDKTRCWACKARVGYLGFTCKCGYTYCAKHRHFDTHGCTYDYKAEAKAKIGKANPTVEAEKLQKL